MKYDLAAMIPPPLTGALWLIYLTGILEAAGAIGLLMPRVRRLAAAGLIALLVALFPANVYAALNGLTLGGRSGDTALDPRSSAAVLDRRAVADQSGDE